VDALGTTRCRPSAPVPVVRTQSNVGIKKSSSASFPN
jgi:hypothetical protein